jgi:hypothetical protein
MLGATRLICGAPTTASGYDENLNFIGGAFFNTVPAYNPSCASLSTSEMHFYGVSFDSCPITILNTLNGRYSFKDSHFESTQGATPTDFITIGSGTSNMVVSVDRSYFREGTNCSGSCTRNEFVKINGAGTFDFTAVQAIAAESIPGFITLNNDYAYTASSEANLTNITSTFSSASTHYSSHLDISGGSFITGTQSCLTEILPAPGGLQACLSNSALSGNQTWTFPGTISGTVGITGDTGTGFYQSVKNTPGCTTGSSLGSDCSAGGGVVTVAWPTAFADANYSVTCTGSGALAGVPGPAYIVAKVAASIQFDYLNMGSSAAGYAYVDCIAVHD